MSGKISIKDLSVRYRPILPDVIAGLSSEFDISGITYLAGRGRVGKSTLFKCLSGVIPSVMAEISGELSIMDTNPITTPLDELRETVRYIGPNPYSSIFGLTVEQEIDFLSSSKKESMEVLGLMGIDHLLHRETNNLSGGEMVRLVLAGALVSGSKTLLLDSPMQELDPQGRQEFLQALSILRGNFEGNIFMSDPFWTDAKDIAEKVVVMEDKNILRTDIDNTNFFSVGWLEKCNLLKKIPRYEKITPGSEISRMSGVHVSLEGNHILKGFDFSLGEGDLVVVAGRNGSGKTTAMLTLANAIKWQNGSVENKGKVSYVFQHPQLQTVAPTIKQELELEPKILKWDENKTKRFVDEILAWLNLDPDTCPLDIHSADRRLLMIGASSHGSILILDEPTIDLDTEDTVKVLDFIQKLRLSGTAVVLITHDHDLMNIANRVVMIDDGRVKDEYVPQEVEIERPVVYSQV